MSSCWQFGLRQMRVSEGFKADAYYSNSLARMHTLAANVRATRVHAAYPSTYALLEDKLHTLVRATR